MSGNEANLMKTIRMIAAIVLVAAAQTAVIPHRAEAEPVKAEAVVPVVSVTTATVREIADHLVVTGTLVPRDEILVTPEIEGHRVTEVLVEEGARVMRGQVLARLSRDLVDRQIAQQKANIDKAAAAVPQAENSIAQSEAAETEARLGFERARQLMQTGNATAVVLETRTSALRQAEGRTAFARNGLVSAKADLEQAKALGDELQLRLARTDIRAPEDGIVSRRTARVGMSASASAEPLFRLIARGEIELEGDVIETKLPMLREGRPAWIELGDGERVKGRVRVVYPEVDRTTRLGKVRIKLDPHVALRIGSFAKGGIEVERRRGVTIPQTAVLYGDTGHVSVLVVSAGVVKSRQVRIGLADNDNVQIREGLSEGEAVVLRAGSFLRDGDRVRAIHAKRTSTAAMSDPDGSERLAQ